MDYLIGELLGGGSIFISGAKRPSNPAIQQPAISAITPSLHHSGFRGGALARLWGWALSCRTPSQT